MNWRFGDWVIEFTNLPTYQLTNYRISVFGSEQNPVLPGVDAILGAFQLDKKYSGGVRFVLLEDVGSPRVVEDVPEPAVRKVLEEMGAR